MKSRVYSEDGVRPGQITRLVINCPPRLGKSSIVTIAWPSWEWAKDDATSRWVFASYSASLSVKHNVDRRTLIASEWYSNLWPKVKLSGDANLKQEFVSTNRGHMFATSVGGSTTGKGGTTLVIDDPHSVEQAYSDVERESAIRYLRQTLMTRLDDPRTGKIVLVMQRLHENDASGEFLRDGGWEHLCLPAVAEARQVISLPSGAQMVREPGDVLEPERFGLETLERLKRSMGSLAYAGQMQQNPTPSEGNLFRRSLWRYWRPKSTPLPEVVVQKPDGSSSRIMPVEIPDSLTLVSSWDMAFKGDQNSDYVVGMIIGQKGPDYFVLDAVRGRWDFPETLRQFRNLSARYPKATKQLVEDKANGPGIIAMLKREIPGIKPVTPEGGKEVRAAAVSPLVESGNVFLPHPNIAAWVSDFIEELAMFPRSRHDDYCDAFTQAVLHISTTPRIYVGVV